MRAGTGGHRLAPWGGGTVTPNQNVIGFRRLSKAQIMAREGQNTPHPGVGQKPAIKVKGPPGGDPGGRLFRMVRFAGHGGPY
jgi:hypothetical protein